MCVAVFIPGQSANDQSTLELVGCASLFDRTAPPVFTECFEGPGGQSGKLVYMHRGAALATYQPEFQEWLDCGKYWLGMSKLRRPTPELLAREPLVDGAPVVLRDGNAWVVPICEYFPKRLTIDRLTGEEIRTVAPEYRDFIEQCNDLFRWFTGDEFQDKVETEKVVVIPNGLTFAAAALSKNYRVNRDLVDLLGLIDDNTAFDVARVATGLSLVDEYAATQKKTGNLVGATS